MEEMLGSVAWFLRIGALLAGVVMTRVFWDFDDRIPQIRSVSRWVLDRGIPPVVFLIVRYIVFLIIVWALTSPFMG